MTPLLVIVFGWLALEILCLVAIFQAFGWLVVLLYIVCRRLIQKHYDDNKEAFTR